MLEVILEVIMEDEGTMVMLLTPGNLEVKVKTAQCGQILLENDFNHSICVSDKEFTDLGNAYF